MELEARKFYKLMSKRRSVRRFTQEKIPVEILQECIRSAGTAPSGANKQPWFFAIVQSDQLKRKIREEAEIEEALFYKERASDDFLNDLVKFNTNWEKPHLEEASALIVIFAKSFEYPDKKSRCYYSKESVGIATGILITALHTLGISTLTHTPNPMTFLNKILGRPQNERPFLILAVGKRDKKYALPDISRKELNEISDTF